MIVLSAATLAELRHARHVYFGWHPYIEFLVKWIAFNRAYHELYPKMKDREGALAYAISVKDRWSALEPLALRLASLECIGGERASNAGILRPKWEVKWATRWLRERLGLDEANPDKCHFAGCRVIKRAVCDGVRYQTDKITRLEGEGEVAALLRLVYQVRCNVFHGEKGLLLSDSAQTNRDKDLVDISARVIDQCIDWLVEDYGSRHQGRQR